MAKPLDGMGDFEELFAQIGGIRGTADFTFEKRAVIVMCADNGIVEEHVSQTGQEVTAIVAENMGKGITSVCRMAEVAGRMYPTKVIPVDIGVNCTREIPGVLQRKVAYGTKNFLKAPAMTEEETLRAIEIGMELVRQCKEEGYEILATGEMGIGNTTTSSAMAAALLQCSAKDVTGKGAGLSKQGIDHKAQVIKTALNKYNLYQADAFTIYRRWEDLILQDLLACSSEEPYMESRLLSTVLSAALRRLRRSALCLGQRILQSHHIRERSRLSLRFWQCLAKSLF